MADHDGDLGQPAAIVFDQVSYAPARGLLRRRPTLFDGLSFAIAPGEAAGLLLPPGAGKTSLVKLATGHDLPSFGSVEVLGRSLVTEPERLTGRVGAVVGEPSQLWRDVPLNDWFALLCQYFGLSEGSEAGLVERLELGPALKTPIGDLTRAQRRRAELATALLPDPELLVLDEPTHGIDADTKERIRSVLRQENRVNGRTLLLASSDLTEVESLCPRLLIGVDGRIGFDGTIAELAEMLGTERILVVDLLSPTAPIDDLPGTDLIAVEAGGLRQRLGIIPGQGTTAKVLADVVARVPVRNLTLEEPDVAELVRRLTP